MFSPLIVFLFLAILAGTITKLMNKYVLKETHPYAFALMTNIVSAIIFFFLAYRKFEFPKEPTAYIILAIAGVLWSIIAITIFISYKKTDVSIRDPLNQSKIIIALILGIIFLKEAPTIYAILGNIIIFLGISTLIFHPEKRFGRLSEPGVKWTIFTAFLSALVAIVDKTALRYFNLETYGFLVYAIPVMFMGLFIHKRMHHVKHLFKIKWKSSLIAIFAGALQYYFVLKAYSLANITFIYPLLQITTLLTVLGGIFFMGEREHFWQKIIATIIIIAGAIILRL